MTKRIAFALAFLALLVLLPREAWAHKPSDSYLVLSFAGSKVDVRWDIALRDLDYVMGLDADGDGNLTWGEVARAPRGDRELCHEQAHAARRRHGAMPRRTSERAPDRPALRRHLRRPPLQRRVRPRASHAERRLPALLRHRPAPLRHHPPRRRRGHAHRDLHHARTARRASTVRRATPGHQLGAAVELGITHIFAGIDHLLFLVALLLPSVLAPMGARDVGPGAAPQARARRRLQDRHRLHSGALHHPHPLGARGAAAAEPARRVGDRHLGGRSPRSTTSGRSCEDERWSRRSRSGSSTASGSRPR